MNYSDIYKQVGVDSDVLGASPHRLIQLLLDKCESNISEAKQLMLSGRVASKWERIQKTIDIVMYLRICLNFKDKNSVKLSQELDRLYYYIQQQLMNANIKNEEGLLDEASRLLADVREGWTGMLGAEVDVVEEAHVE